MLETKYIILKHPWATDFNFVVATHLSNLTKKKGGGGLPWAMLEDNSCNLMEIIGACVDMLTPLKQNHLVNYGDLCSLIIFIIILWPDLIIM